MTSQQTLQHRHVREASLQGIGAATTANTLGAIAHLFSWESTDRGPALLFLGTGLRSEAIDQNTWFQFEDNAPTVQYTVRLLDLPEGDNRGIFTAVVSLEEAAHLVDMCIEQALGQKALLAERERAKAKPYHIW